MSFEKYEVMNEFFKIAEKQDLLGLKKTASPEKNPHQEDLKTIEEKRLKSPEKSIIEDAHPKSVYVAESRGDGGLVENQLEQQKKLIEVINKMPTGSLVGRYASAAIQLVKMANECDQMGNEEAADLLTEAASELFNKIAEEEDRCKACGGYGFVTNPEVKELGPAAEWYVDCPACGGKTRDLHVTPPEFEEGPPECQSCKGSGRKKGPSMMYGLHPHMSPSEKDLGAEFDHGPCPSCSKKEDSSPFVPAPTK